MVDHIYDWLALLGRWAHILTGIAWIGSSFFFMWLDAGLEKPDDLEEGVEGELFLVHSAVITAFTKSYLAMDNFQKCSIGLNGRQHSLSLQVISFWVSCITQEGQQ